MTERAPGASSGVRERRATGAAARPSAGAPSRRSSRFVVPHRTDGPKVTLGVAWFVAAVGAAWLATPVLAVVVGAVAALAALQTANAFDPLVDRNIAAGAAALVTLGGLIGSFGVGVTTVFVSIGLGALAATVDSSTIPVRAAAGPQRRPLSGAERHRAAIIAVGERSIRSAVPVGVAAGSLVGLARLDTGTAIALVVLVSAYEIGDFLVGTGSANAFEGPIAGITALVVAASAVYFVIPEPFTTDSFPLFAVLTLVAAPAGQVAASAVLPRGDTWAPALRRLDSYLLAAPLWLVLVPHP